MGRLENKKYIDEIGIQSLMCNTNMGSKIYILKNNKVYKKLPPEYSDLRRKINRSFKDDLLEQTEYQGHPIINFPETIISSDKWLSGIISEYIQGEEFANISPLEKVDYLLYIIDYMEQGLSYILYKGWTLEDIHEENILITQDESHPIKIIDTDFYTRTDSKDELILLQNYRNNMANIFHTIMNVILPKFDQTTIFNHPRIQEKYIEAISGKITCSEFLKEILIVIKFSQKKEQNIISLQKSIV